MKIEIVVTRCIWYMFLILAIGNVMIEQDYSQAIVWALIAIAWGQYHGLRGKYER